MKKENAERLFWAYQDKVSNTFVLQKMLDEADDRCVERVYGAKVHNPTTVLLLSIFLGGLGIDRFIIGDIALGVCKLLFGWLTGYIWWIVDIFLSYKKAKIVNMRNISMALGGHMTGGAPTAYAPAAAYAPTAATPGQSEQKTVDGASQSAPAAAYGAPTADDGYAEYARRSAEEKKNKLTLIFTVLAGVFTALPYFFSIFLPYFVVSIMFIVFGAAGLAFGILSVVREHKNKPMLAAVIALIVLAFFAFLFFGIINMGGYGRYYYY